MYIFGPAVAEASKLRLSVLHLKDRIYRVIVLVHVHRNKQEASLVVIYEITIIVKIVSATILNNFRTELILLSIHGNLERIFVNKSHGEPVHLSIGVDVPVQVIAVIKEQRIVLRRRIEILHVEHRFISICRNLRIELVDIDSIVENTENKRLFFDRVDRAVDHV